MNNELASKTIRDLQPDVVLFDRFMTEEQFSWRVEEEAPAALRILNTEDLHSLRKSRQTALEQDRECDLGFWLEQENTLRELSSILRSDVTLMISQAECEWLDKTGIIPAELVVYLPFMLNNITKYKSDNYTSYNQRKNFIFFGYGRHAPNADAVRFLIGSIWPFIRQELPHVCLEIYGKDYPADVQQLHDPSAGIHLMGWTPDIQTILAKTRVNLAPLRFGAGLKGKIVHAIEQGTPSIATHIGAEGLLPSKGYENVIDDDPETFAAKAVQLYQHEALWQQMTQTTFGYIMGEMDGKKHHATLHKRLDTLLESLERHRTAHVLGRILRHSNHQSTRYMAKWIEAKNRS